MESQDLRLAMIQWVEHFERLGVRYLPKPNEIEPDLLAEWFTTESAAEPPVQPRIQTPPISNAQPSPSPTSTPSAIPRPSPDPKPVADQSSGTWKTSPLALDERTRAMDNLRTQVAACKLCTDLACRRQNTVFGVGPLNTRFVMVGEAPGADEDRIGEPFVGAAGQLLDKILIATGIPREQVYILNTLKCRPPNNRVPTEEEMANCRPYFEQQLEILQPDYIICWGTTAVRAILNVPTPIGQLRGKFHRYKQAKVVVTYHPAYLLRTPEAKRLTWDDMKMLMRELGTLKE